MSMDLGDSGKAIWSAYKAETLEAGHQALILEFARCADMCDKLNGLAAGREESWAQLVFDDMGEIHLVIDKILELRLKHQLALKALYGEVRAAKIEASGAAGKAKDEKPTDALSLAREAKERRERQSG